EMEVTGQAFEDMQEQNIRLMQQLREKDDANFKLMSERIKSNQIHKLLKEEKDMLTEQILTLQVCACSLVFFESLLTIPYARTNWTHRIRWCANWRRRSASYRTTWP